MGKDLSKPPVKMGGIYDYGSISGKTTAEMVKEYADLLESMRKAYDKAWPTSTITITTNNSGPAESHIGATGNWNTIEVAHEPPIKPQATAPICGFCWVDIIGTKPPDKNRRFSKAKMLVCGFCGEESLIDLYAPKN